MKTFFFYAIPVLLTIKANGQSWQLTGNAGTNPSLHFIGTVDNQPLKFRVQNISAGYLDLYNTALGRNSLMNPASIYNTAIGNYAMYSNSNGAYNVAIGSITLYRNTTGSNNSATGYGALSNNGSGSYNTAGGANALYGNTIGSYNSASGYEALYSNSTGSQNSAMGASALLNNNTGTGNTAEGKGSLVYNSTGSYNTANGLAASTNNETGYENTSMGAYALYSNVSGSLNTAVGFAANVTSPSFNNATAIGNQALVDASNKVRIGNTSVMTIGGQVGWTIFSDGRFKQQIREDIPGIDFIKKLRPISYTVDIPSLNNFYSKNNPSLIANIGTHEQDPWMKESVRVASTYRHSGFVAQEVEQAAKNSGYTFSGVDAPADAKGLYGLRYDEFVVPLVKAVQELAAKNEALEEKLQKLEAAITQTNKLSTGVTNAFSNTSGASLEQNAPNPFNNETVIRYYVPYSSASAKIVIANANGQVLKSVPINGAGAGQIILNSGFFAAGNYVYSLWIGVKQVESRKMIIQK